MSSWQFYLTLTLLFLLTQGIFAMLEMACVSFNRVRLQYWVLKKRRARWLHYLLSKPTLLFGATLIGVNASLIAGSECSRRLYEALGFNPDFAPFTQIILVLIFAELAPLFAGRRYAEHAAMLGVPLLYFLSFLLRPVIFLFDQICSLVNRLFQGSMKEGIYLSREDLQHLFEERDEALRPNKEINQVVRNLFSLKSMEANDLMTPINQVQTIPSFCSVGEMRMLLNYHYAPFLPIYKGKADQVEGIVYPRDLIRASEEEKVKKWARSAWFITEKSSILEILKQFRKNNQSLAVVLNEAGNAIGFLTLDKIIDQIFGKEDDWDSFEEISPRAHHVVVDRTFLGDMHIKDFNYKFKVHLEPGGCQTLEELFEKQLGRAGEKGESVRVDQFELTLEEAPLMGPKKIAIRTLF